MDQEQEIRLQCLKLAAAAPDAHSSQTIITKATEMAAFVMNGSQMTGPGTAGTSS
jgi:hypothetical protein